jgi:hypothetical protein
MSIRQFAARARKPAAARENVNVVFGFSPPTTGRAPRDCATRGGARRLAHHKHGRTPGWLRVRQSASRPLAHR